MLGSENRQLLAPSFSIFKYSIQFCTRGLFIHLLPYTRSPVALGESLLLRLSWQGIRMPSLWVEIPPSLLGRWEHHALRFAYLIAGMGVDPIRRDAPSGQPGV